MTDIISKFTDDVFADCTAFYKETFKKQCLSILQVTDIDESLLQNYLDVLKHSLTNVIKKSSYVLKSLRNAVASGRLSAAAAKKPSIEVSSIEDNLVEDTESVEKDIDEWFKILDEYDAIAEKKGFKPHYRQQASGKFIDKYGNVRGHFDGNGGFIYTDGTKSSRWPTIEEKHDGGATF